MSRGPAQRLSALQPSPIRRLHEGAPPGTVFLGLGEPTWDLPLPARLALADLPPGPTPYGPNAGLPDLREAIAHHHGAHPDEVVVTVGSEEALFSLFLAYLNPGDDVLVPDPGFPAYAALAHLAGARPVPCPLDPHGHLDAETFLDTLRRHPRLRLAVLNAPSNPTGGIASLTALRQVAEACDAADVLLVSDEVYRELHADLRPPSLRDVTDTGLVVSSVSKAWGAPGLRVGWIVGPRETLAPVRLIHGYAVTCATAPAQRAALALLQASEAILPAARQEVDTRWEALARAFPAHLGMSAPPRPAGAFYLWLPLPGPRRDDMAFCLHARDRAGVAVVPGSAFGPAGAGHLRISYAAAPTTLEEGLRRLGRVWKV